MQSPTRQVWRSWDRHLGATSVTPVARRLYEKTYRLQRSWPRTMRVAK